MRKETIICPWCGDPLTYEDKKVSCNKCLLEINLSNLDILIKIKKLKEELEVTRNQYLAKEEELRRLCTVLSISFMEEQKSRRPQNLKMNG